MGLIERWNIEMYAGNKDELMNNNQEKKEYERVEIELIDFSGEENIFECEGSQYW